MTDISLRHDAAPLAAARAAALTGRGATEPEPGVVESTRAILADVRARGDDALREQAARFDGVTLGALEVPPAACEAALAALPADLRAALEHAVRNLARAHEAFAPRAVTVQTEPGVRVGRRPEPLARVGIYAPGGRAVYPSSVLMAALPAVVAGVGEIVLCTPAQRESGAPHALTLAAAALSGVHRVFAVGGAGAIAAMAYGTASVPRVDAIVGPGNAWVAEAKRQLAGLVRIDSPAGPSELLLLADDSADPDALARELVAQAEHDPDAAALAVVVGEAAARALAQALRAAAAAADRSAIVAASLAARGGVLVAQSRDEALAFACEYAPEHLLLALSQPREALAAVRNAGAVFVGAHSSVAFGDYLAGGNHVLPTAGFARALSGLSTGDFVRWTAWQEVSAAGAAALAADTATFANAEGLPGHAAAALGAKEVAR